MDILTIFVSAIFVNNILLSQFLGNCPYLGCSREKGVVPSRLLGVLTIMPG